MSDERIHMQSREAEKSTAVAEICFVLDHLVEQRRNPDHWERVCLARAVGALFSGCYSLATVEARITMIPPNQRSPFANLPTDEFFDWCDLPLLRRALNEAIAEPVRQFPHLGPIEIR
jgi:hypothetical protein